MSKHHLIVAIFILSGCLPNSELAIASVTPPLFPSPAISETATLDVATSRATPQPPEPTFPPGPTFTVEESQREIAKLLRGNPDCLFPCWWGIVPGKTSRSYAMATMAHLNLEWSPFELPEGIEYGSPFLKDGDFIQATIGFTVNDQIVEDIHVRGSSGSDPIFADRWDHYSLTEILITYGPPSRLWAVMVKGSRISYHLLVFYDETKSLIRYSGSSTRDVFCPDFSQGEVDWLDIYLQIPGKLRKLTDITNVSKTIELLDQPDVYWVEKMTDARINELYDLFTQSNEPACFKTTAN